MTAREPSGDNWVKLTEAGDNAQASIIRSYLENSGITVFVQGENHRSMLGMVGAYIALNILVPEDEYEDACALMEEYNSAEEEADPVEMRGPFRDEFDDEDDDESWRESADLARNIKRARFAALIFPVGGGHFSAGAPIRGLVLGALVIGGIWGAIVSGPALALLIPFSVVSDYQGVRGVLQQRARAAAQQSAADSQCPGESPL